MRRVLLLTLALALVGCGQPDAALWVRVEAPLIIPTDCDALQLQVTRTGQTAPAYDRTFPLKGDVQFPLTLMLVTNDLDNVRSGTLNVTAAALKAQALSRTWSQASATVQLAEHTTVDADLVLCDCQ